MKLMLLGVSMLMALPSWAAKDVFIQEVEFTETRMDNVIRTLSELSQSNIIATPEAAKKTVTIHLKKVSVLNAIKSISRISDLWYRYDDDTDTYRLMTREEYGKDLIVRESDNIEIFRLLNANVQIIAQAIEDIYGQRVILSLGIPAAANSVNNSNGMAAVRGGNSTVRNISSSRQSSRRTSSRSRSGSVRGSFDESGMALETQELSIDQIDRIATALEQSGNRNIDQQTLQENTVQSQPIHITVNNEHNMLIVRTDDQAVLTGIRQLIKEMDIPVPQVMLEMRILSVLLGEDFNSIFNFELQPSGSNQSQQPILFGNNALLNSGSFVFEFLNSRLRANLEFLEENNRVRVLSNPMVVASNHREAELFIGEETLLTEGFEFFPAIIDNGVVVQPSYVQAIVNREDIGITLRITPRINGDDTVELDIEQENSTVNPGGGIVPITDGTGTVKNLPVDTVDTARLTGTVMAKDGLTVAVGGLIRTSKNKNERKVPLLSEIPVIGRVFRSTTESEQDTETVLLITPRVMNVPEESETLRQTDNRFYRNYNQHFPATQEFDNKFIQVNKAAEKSKFIPDHSQAIGFSDMTNFAAQMLRTPELQRTDDDTYKAISVIPIAAGLVANPAIKTVPRESWNKGYHYVTAVTLFNRSDKVIELDESIVNGEWVSVAMESEQLAPTGTDQASTMLYLISDAPFNDVLSDITSTR
jgi:general secretion pathway protein D